MDTADLSVVVFWMLLMQIWAKSDRIVRDAIRLDPTIQTGWSPVHRMNVMLILVIVPTFFSIFSSLLQCWNYTYSCRGSLCVDYLEPDESSMVGCCKHVCGYSSCKRSHCSLHERASCIHCCTSSFTMAHGKHDSEIHWCQYHPFFCRISTQQFGIHLSHANDLCFSFRSFESSTRRRFCSCHKIARNVLIFYVHWSLSFCEHIIWTECWY